MICIAGRPDNIIDAKRNATSSLPPQSPPGSPKATHKDNKTKVQPFTYEVSRTWTRHSCQSMSAVLNDPSRRGRQVDMFTKMWGESFVPQEVVPLTLLQLTPMSYFSEYWKKIELVR